MSRIWGQVYVIDTRPRFMQRLNGSRFVSAYVALLVLAVFAGIGLGYGTAQPATAQPSQPPVHTAAPVCPPARGQQR